MYVNLRKPRTVVPYDHFLCQGNPQYDIRVLNQETTIYVNLQKQLTVIPYGHFLYQGHLQYHIRLLNQEITIYINLQKQLTVIPYDCFLFQGHLQYDISPKPGNNGVFQPSKTTNDHTLWLFPLPWTSPI